jgi:hypothetical protein
VSLELCDERLGAADLEHPAEHVWITCSSSQFARMRALSREFRDRGKTVMVGGILPTMAPDAVRPWCDVLFRGEFEGAAEGLFEDFAAGRWKPEYDGGRADLARAPRPLWDLYPNDRTMLGCVQTSRGCPFDCSFCEIVAYYGRGQRHKPVGAVIAEVDALYRLGYRSIFFTDDNIAGVPERAKEVLAAVAAWNDRRPADRVQFLAQMPLSAAKDAEFLALCARSGLTHLWVGVETPDPAGMEEAGKKPNMGVDLVPALRAFAEHGISVVPSMILGFDADGPEVFGKHERFLTEVPAPLAQLNPLVVAAGTPLHAKLKAEHRLTWGSLVAGRRWATNVIPRQLSQEALLSGLQDLAVRLFAPEAFTARFKGFLEMAGRRGGAVYAAPPGAGPCHSAFEDAWALVDRRLSQDPSLVGLRDLVAAELRARPEREAWLRTLVFFYLQAEHAVSG